MLGLSGRPLMLHRPRQEATMQDWMTLRWTTLLARGLVGVVFGVVAMAWPDETVTVLVVIWGCWALLDGVIVLAVAGRVPGTALRVVAILAGAVALLVAFFAIARPVVAAETLTWFLGVWLVVRGVLEIVQASSADEAGGRWVLVLGGLVDGALGVLFMANPGTAVLGIAFILGLLAFVWGLAILGLALFVRRAAPRSGADVADRAYG
ncbi:MAG: HdeD family acid-resistance protein [Nocardioides sp.]